ncbi:hypothetical protein [Paenibacillus sp. LK1]|uniref:hypothetical protein n=1 Tax=Paenibacillus sp. LK1 TaxID=2053014 RepID=UPI000C194E4F|nr:hypothetical protein [Paenibacillus sp. LK1]PIH59011.1 hypothetical protein CS562_13785 [Paenibacillus sp. LK1]
MTIQEPKKNFVTVTCQQGRYTLGSSEESARYYFVIGRDDAKDLWKSFLVDIEKDCINYRDMTPLEVAYEIKEVYDGYWIHSGVGDIQKMIDYLENIEEEEEKLREEYELEYAKYKVEYWSNQVKELESVKIKTIN